MRHFIVNSQKRRWSHHQSFSETAHRLHLEYLHHSHQFSRAEGAISPKWSQCATTGPWTMESPLWPLWSPISGIERCLRLCSSLQGTRGRLGAGLISAIFGCFVRAARVEFVPGTSRQQQPLVHRNKTLGKELPPSLPWLQWMLGFGVSLYLLVVFMAIADFRPCRTGCFHNPWPFWIQFPITIMETSDVSSTHTTAVTIKTDKTKSCDNSISK